jgi:hydroxyacylglutathione hydrolase
MEIRRILAPNPGPYTGDGTNTWLIEAEAPVLIDPGPDLEAHLAAILAALTGRKLAAILVTHGHRDHSGLAPRLGAATGAAIWADAHPLGRRQGISPGPGVDLGFRPDEVLSPGARLRFGGIEIEALHTPGHLDSHYAFALGERLFSGDHVMGWSTSVVMPPEGDMADYRASLARLAERVWARAYPGHGPEIADPGARIAELIAHRNARADQILATLAQGAMRLEDLLPRIYPGLAPALEGAALGNLAAHLEELIGQGHVTEADPSHYALRMPV